MVAGESYAARWRAFGWHSIVVDGHDLAALLDAFEEARHTRAQPTMILARTIKGKGMSIAEGKSGWHGKAFKKGEELDRALAEPDTQLRLFGKPGVRGHRRMGVALARGATVQEALDKANHAAAAVTVSFD